MTYAIYCFTSKGRVTAEKIIGKIAECDIFSKEKYADKNDIIFHSLGELLKENFSKYKVHIFISATGIAVRSIAGLIKSKESDPAVIVIDDSGNFVIPILSGHLGGANAESERLAEILNAIPVITTASDNGGKTAVDTISQKIKCKIENMERAKKVTALIVNNEKVLLKIPDNIVTDKDTNVAGAVIVSNRKQLEISKLIPKNLIVGIGCRKDISKEAVINAISTIFEKFNLEIEAIKKFSSVWVKAQEKGLLEAVEYFQKDIEFHSKEEVEKVDIEHRSEFVEKTIGVKGVSEPCAYLSSCRQGQFIVKKEICSGVTISIFEEEVKIEG